MLPASQWIKGGDSEMEVRSSDSAATSEEYDMLKTSSTPSPDRTSGLLVGDESKLEESLKECIEEQEEEAGDATKSNVSRSGPSDAKASRSAPSDDKVSQSDAPVDGRIVSSSEVFEEQSIREENLNTVLANENLLDDTDHTIFHNIFYMGHTNIADPRNESLIQETMASLNKEAVQPLSVTVSVPKSSADSVVMREAATRTRVASIRIHRIIFLARGDLRSEERACFAFTCAANEPELGTLIQCHVFRCEVAEAVERIFVSFAKAFKKPKGPVERRPSSQTEEETVIFEVGLEIKEDDGKGNFVTVPRDKDTFKLRANVEKRVLVTLAQISDSLKLKVERCFGMLVSPGRNVRHCDMQLLEGVKMTPAQGTWLIQGPWDPSEAAFAVLNQETGPDIHSVYMTVAADLVIGQIADPVRFVVETRARIYPPSERFWYYSRRSVIRRYHMVIKRQGDALQLIEVRQGDEVETVQQGGGRISALLASGLASWRGSDNQEPSSPLDQEEESDTDEPLLSGSGGVSKDCSETELVSWGEVLALWTTSRPKQLAELVEAGVPEALRGEVWQRLSGASESMESTIENYKILITKETPDEKVIFRDIHRTFPAHEFFREAGGAGQEALFRISKAYSVYDSEVGYCQGQSFLIAALLLQMPEEQSFGVLVQMMHKYGLRDMFKENFEHLNLKFYQLEKLVETRLPDLHAHFQEIGLATQMYASQWFLTLFAAKFPLFLVFRVLDVFLLYGADVIFQVSLALLMMARKELLALDFEATMKYFRVNIPRRLRSEEHAKQLMKSVCGIKIKKLARYEKEWRRRMEEERLAVDPLTRFERENKKLIADNMRLERENDMLARQLLTSKITMRADLDKLEDLKESLEKEVGTSKLLFEEVRGEKLLLSEEAEQLKLLLKREIEKLDGELKAKDNIIADYKEITKQMSEKLERKERGEAEERLGQEENESPLEAALARIHELELELAQTKLALVETECRNQDLAHQFSASQEMQKSSNTWFTKTLSSIKEAATTSKSHQDLKKSSSEHATLGHSRTNSKS